MHVDDLGDGVVFALENWDPSSNKVFLNNKENSLNYLNIGTGKDISIKDLSIKIAKLCQYNGEIIWDKSKPDGTRQKLLNVSKINSLGWEAKINIDDGIRRTIKDFKKYFLKQKITYNPLD